MNEIDHCSNDEHELRNSKRVKVERSYGDNFLTYLLEKEPQTYHEIVTSNEGSPWKEVINGELDSILYNHNWELVIFHAGC